ncbi:hypothetical protein RIF29_34515 [Crotalaria pallida]|uniref:Late embryogenesis abundant protein LEA-2 subgroup domain-containing protein n=1 Tax=Crotalaria pallida TaxID=3830 RepID=A0AAN9HR99_CROPI
MAHNHINKEHVKPLAPYISSSTHFNIQEHQIQTVSNSNQKTILIGRFIRCCGCFTALLLIFLVIIIVLGFTVYNVKEPEVKLYGMNLLNGTFTKEYVPNGITLVAVDVSLKNTNDFTFMFGNTTTIIYYDGIGIGEGITPPRRVKAKRTIRFNVTMEVMAKKLTNSPSFKRDIRDQALNFSTYTKIDGKVRILELFKKRVVVELNCKIEYNFTYVSHGTNCLSSVDI